MFRRLRLARPSRASSRVVHSRCQAIDLACETAACYLNSVLVQWLGDGVGLQEASCR